MTPALLPALPVNPLTQPLIQSALSGIVSPHTYRAYHSHLTRFLLSGSPLTRAGVQTWVSALRKGKGSGTVNQALAAIRKLSEEAMEAGVLDRVEWAGIKGVRGAKRNGGKVGNWLPLPVTKVFLSLPHTVHGNKLRGIRDSALLAVMVGCGLRREEVVRLELGQYTELAGRMVLEVKGKGGKVRTVPVPDWVEDTLSRWVLEMDTFPAGGPIPSHPGPTTSSALNVATYSKALYTGSTTALFRTIRRGIPGGRLGVQGIYYLVKGYGERIGMGGLAPHDLRRTFGKLAREGGAEMDQIRKVMGHSSVVVTERYLGDGVELGKGRGVGDHIKI